MSREKAKHAGILKNTPQHSARIDKSLKINDHDDVFQRKEAPDKFEEEFNESFKARQRRRSAGNILPIAAERVKHEVSVKLNIPNSRKVRTRQLSSEYCE